MYQPKRYSEVDEATMLSFMQTHPFVTLITNDSKTSFATQIPIMIEQRTDGIYLLGHVSKHTDHYPVLNQNNEVLLMFTGAHCYVSASWYKERGQASTWNYMTVQARGTIKMMDNAKSLDLLKTLTHHYEDSQEQPELVEDMPEDYVAANVKAIAGFEVKVSKLNATFKLNQNKSDESYKNVVAKLMATNDIESISIAGKMMQLRPELFA